MHPNELNAILGKRTKSTNDINLVKPRLCTKAFTQTQCRQSELELIFQVNNFLCFYLSIIYLFFFI
jgi:hypothetical protein